jgi:uracil-DNA glycosylase
MAPPPPLPAALRTLYSNADGKVDNTVARKLPDFKPLLKQGTRILLVGEFPSEEEEARGYPFTGKAGRELESELEEAGTALAEVSATLVLTKRPPGGDINNWCVPVKEAIEGKDPALPWQQLRGKSGMLPAKQVQPELVRLYREISEVKPNVIVALGNMALSALTGEHGIGKLRGTIHLATIRGLPYKVLPTYSPWSTSRQYEQRPTVIADLQKAIAESYTKEWIPRERLIYVEPTLDDLWKIWFPRLQRAHELTVDIETKRKQITCIGFSPTPYESYVLPFFFQEKNYWPDIASEREAYKFMRAVLKLPAVKIFQNGMYDITYLWYYKCPTINCREDTMLLHHALFPALPKALGYIGSIYANERSWKVWRQRGGEEKENA